MQRVFLNSQSSVFASPHQRHSHPPKHQLIYCRKSNCAPSLAGVVSAEPKLRNDLQNHIATGPHGRTNITTRITYYLATISQAGIVANLNEFPDPHTATTPTITNKTQNTTIYDTGDVQQATRLRHLKMTRSPNHNRTEEYKVRKHHQSLDEHTLQLTRTTLDQGHSHERSLGNKLVVRVFARLVLRKNRLTWVTKWIT
jgi:hypothetical protein